MPDSQRRASKIGRAPGVRSALHYHVPMAALEDLEARIAAMEAAHADYRAVLAAVNALGANRRDLADGQRKLRAARR